MLNRTALRLATMMAFLNGRQGTPPLLVGDNIYESRVRDLLQGDKSDDEFPIAVIYTNDMQAQNNVNIRYNPTDEQVILEIECGMVQAQDGALGTPQTDPEQEARIDLLTSQMMTLINYANTPWTRLFWKVCKKIVSVESNRMTSEDGRTKFAMRNLIIVCELSPDCAPYSGAPSSETYDLTAFFQQHGGTPAQQQALQDRMNATLKMPDPLSTVIQEIEKNYYPREIAGVDPADVPQEITTIRTQFLSAAPDGPYASIDAIEDDNVSTTATIRQRGQYVGTEEGQTADMPLGDATVEQST